MTVLDAFESFMASSFESAVDSATNASYSGSGYSVELFEDGEYRVLWDGNIGNRYVSPGLVLGVPSLDEEDDDEEDRFYDNAEEQMRQAFQAFQEHLAEY